MTVLKALESVAIRPGTVDDADTLRPGFKDVSHHPIRAEGWALNGKTWVTIVLNA